MNLLPRTITDYIFGDRSGPQPALQEPETAGALIEAKGLSKRLGAVTVVDNLSFVVRNAEVVGLLGPDGAGKTTVLRLICGTLPPDAGTAVIIGHDVIEHPLDVKARIGYLPQGAPLYGEMTPAALVGFVAGVRGLTGALKVRRIEMVIEAMLLKPWWRQPMTVLPNAARRRVGLACAVLANPQALILDEPTRGLEPEDKHEIWRLLAEMTGDKAILVSTCDPQEAATVCDRILRLDHGRLACEDTPAAEGEKPGGPTTRETAAAEAAKHPRGDPVTGGMSGGSAG